MAEFLKGRKKLWPISAIRPRIGRKTPPMDRLNLCSRVLTSVYLPYRWPFHFHYIFVLILKKLKKLNHLNRPFINLSYDLFGHIFMALSTFRLLISGHIFFRLSDFRRLSQSQKKMFEMSRNKTYFQSKKIQKSRKLKYIKITKKHILYIFSSI